MLLVSTQGLVLEFAPVSVLSCSPLFLGAGTGCHLSQFFPHFIFNPLSFHRAFPLMVSGFSRFGPSRSRAGSPATCMGDPMLNHCPLPDGTQQGLFPLSWDSLSGIGGPTPGLCGAFPMVGPPFQIGRHPLGGAVSFSYRALSIFGLAGKCCPAPPKFSCGGGCLPESLRFLLAPFFPSAFRFQYPPGPHRPEGGTGNSGWL